MVQRTQVARRPQHQSQNALVPFAEKVRGIAHRLARAEAEIAAVSRLNPPRVIRGFIAALEQNRDLADCTPESLTSCMVSASSLDLTCDPRVGQAYLIPRKSTERGNVQCTLTISYRGMVQLAIQAGQCRKVEANTVHENDHFELEYGLEPRLSHRPAFRDRGAFVGVWAAATLADRTVQVVFLDADEVATIRAKSECPTKGPWSQFFGEMAKKSAVRRLLKMVLLTPAFEQKLEQLEPTEGRSYQQAVSFSAEAALPAPAADDEHDTIDAEASLPAPGPATDDEETAEEWSSRQAARAIKAIDEATDPQRVSAIVAKLHEFKESGRLLEVDFINVQQAAAKRKEGELLAATSPTAACPACRNTHAEELGRLKNGNHTCSCGAEWDASGQLIRGSNTDAANDAAAAPWETDDAASKGAT